MMIARSSIKDLTLSYRGKETNILGKWQVNWISDIAAHENTVDAGATHHHHVMTQ